MRTRACATYERLEFARPISVARCDHAMACLFAMTTNATNIIPLLVAGDRTFEPASCVRPRTQVPAVRQRSPQGARSLPRRPRSGQDTGSRRADRAAHCPRAGLPSAYLQEECYRNHTFEDQALIQINSWYCWPCGPRRLTRDQLLPIIIESEFIERRNVCALSCNKIRLPRLA